MFCKNCGSELKPDTAFCGSCGVDLKQAPTQPKAEPVADHVPQKKKDDWKVDLARFSVKRWEWEKIFEKVKEMKEKYGI